MTVSGDDVGIIWDAKTGQIVSLLEGHSGAIRSVVLTFLGRFAVTARWGVGAALGWCVAASGWGGLKDWVVTTRWLCWGAGCECESSASFIAEA